MNFNRKYQDACNIIKHYQKTCGAEKAGKININLLEKYPKPPAFVDELKKLNIPLGRVL